jgi:hypothetical protein
MSFLAGIVSFDGLSVSSREAFEKALARFRSHDPRNLDRTEDASWILVHSGPSDMWEGPRVFNKKEYVALATGIQWRKTPSQTPATEYLSDRFLQCAEIENCFDYFSIAILNRSDRKCTLAVDPLCRFTCVLLC